MNEKIKLELTHDELGICAKIFNEFAEKIEALSDLKFDTENADEDLIYFSDRYIKAIAVERFKQELIRCGEDVILTENDVLINLNKLEAIIILKVIAEYNFSFRKKILSDKELDAKLQHLDLLKSENSLSEKDYLHIINQIFLIRDSFPITAVLTKLLGLIK